MLKFFKMSYKHHIILAIFIRLVLIAYGELHDKISEVPYTDIDYRVFTDAARHILNSHSPYDRHTYRYSPILAIILIPNILFTGCYGKLFFSLIDIFVGLLIYSLVKLNRKNYTISKKGSEKIKILPLEEQTENVVDSKVARNVRKRKGSKSSREQIKIDKKTEHDFAPNYCMQFWLYNPMSIIISTRGNCDSIAVFLVLLTLYYLQVKKNYFVAGLTHGLSIHFRLYPVIYSLTYFMYLSGFSRYDTNGQQNNEIFAAQHLSIRDNLDQIETKKDPISLLKMHKKKTIFKKEYFSYLIPNKYQLQLIFGTILSLATFTGLFYFLYGYKFLHETYIYHLIRKDTRHNFSLFFYLQYLTAGVKNIGLWQKVLCILPQLVLLLVLSVRYGLNRFTLHFSIVTQTIVMVTYNSVLTSQYFIWILGILPLVLWQLDMTVRMGIVMTIAWFVAQLAWLLPAYLLEFLGRNTFLFIWLQGVSFFCANMAVLGRLVKCFMYRVD